ncbi:glycerate kinase [Bacillus rossius redtenbacheri]|uniref:glycerate kinase n=1 Tax=Bacillus rossius redtenbacheri TaxID=93214 RepID=UPI002FDC84CA
MFVVRKTAKTLPLRVVDATRGCTASCREMEGVKADLWGMFLASVSAVDPCRLVRDAMAVSGDSLVVRGARYALCGNCLVVGFGKAVLGMAAEAERILGDRVVAGAVSVPRGILGTLADKREMLPDPGSRLEVHEGAARNLPDPAAARAAGRIKEIAESAGEGDVLLVLVSGGGSALLPAPRPPVTLEEKCRVITLLASAGADIMELNCVRKRLSLLKGGGLARAASPARVVTLVLSDVIGDPLDFIASGPTVPNTDPPDAPIDVIRKHRLLDEVPSSVICSLRESSEESAGTDGFDHVQNVIIGSNTLAVESAKNEASRCGYFPAVLSTRIQGLVKNVGKMYADLAGEICKCISDEANNLPALLSSFKERYELLENVESEIMCGVERAVSGQGLCLIAGGETTVLVRGKGVGGRNQELALEFAMSLHALGRDEPCLAGFDIALLSCGTDGIDGPTSAAGAIGHAAQCSDDSFKPSRFLANNDSHSFYRCFKGGSDLVTIGHTGTNVMDIHILAIKKKI